MSFLIHRYGQETVNKAIESLQPDDRAVWPAVFLDSTWSDDKVGRALRRLGLMPGNRRKKNQIRFVRL